MRVLQYQSTKINKNNDKKTALSVAGSTQPAIDACPLVFIDTFEASVGGGSTAVAEHLTPESSSPAERHHY